VTLLINTIFLRGWDNVVGIPTTLWAERFGIRTLASLRDFIFSTPVKDGLGALPASCSMDTGSFPGLKRLGCDVDLSPLSSAEVKKMDTAIPYTLSLPPVIRYEETLSLPPAIWADGNY